MYVSVLQNKIQYNSVVTCHKQIYFTPLLHTYCIAIVLYTLQIDNFIFVILFGTKFLMNLTIGSEKVHNFILESVSNVIMPVKRMK